MMATETLIDLDTGQRVVTLKEIKWTLDEAQGFLNKYNNLFKSCGYSAKIVGGVAANGYSTHDLDILLIPFTEDEFNFEPILEHFYGGFANHPTYGELYCTCVNGKWIDFFFNPDTLTNTH